MTVRQALHAKLTGDVALTALLASPESVYHQLAPEGAKTPYIVMQRLPGTRQWAFQGGQIRWRPWAIFAVDRSKSAEVVEAIDERIDSLLTDATLTIEGFNHLYLRRQSDLPEPVEPDSGEIIQRCGGLYKIATEPA